MNRIVVPVYGSDSTPDFTLQPAPDPEPESEFLKQELRYIPHTSVKSRRQLRLEHMRNRYIVIGRRKPNGSRFFRPAGLVVDCQRFTTFLAPSHPLFAHRHLADGRVEAFGMSRPIEMPATTAHDQQNRSPFVPLARWH